MSQFKKNVVLFKDVAASTTSKTQCNSAQFSATTDGGTAPVICGTNTGYHSKTISLITLIKPSIQACIIEN